MEKQSSQSQTTQSGSMIPESVEWYFVFTDGTQHEIPRWQKAWLYGLTWLENLFSEEDTWCPTHCFAFAQVGPFIHFVEPTRSQIVNSIKYDDKGGALYAEDAVTLLRQAGCTVERVDFVPNLKSWRHCLSWVPTCVSALKIICGIPSLALTPKQLYNWVKNNQKG